MIQKMMKKCCNKDLGLLLLRLVIALVFIQHGYGKFVTMDHTISFFAALGLPAFVAYGIATVELVGGIFMLVGIATKIAGTLLAFDMLFAMLLLKSPIGFSGHEFELVLFAASIAIASVGAGIYALGPKICPCCKGGKCSSASCGCHMVCDTENCGSGDLCGSGDKKMTCDNCDMCKDGCAKHE